MCILSDRDIRKAISQGEVVIEPFDEDTQLGPSSIDLRLGNKFRLFKHGSIEYIDVRTYKDEEIIRYTRGNTVVREFENSILYENVDYFIVHPGEFLLSTTLERVSLSSSLVGRLEGRSSLGRLGIIVHATAGYIDPGFNGRITLEIANVGKVPVKLYVGMRICQLTLERLSSPAEIPYNKRSGSKYMMEDGATTSRISMDFNKHE